MQSRRGFLRSLAVAGLAAVARVYPTPAVAAVTSIFPKGSMAGVSRTTFTWEHGLMVKDWRYFVRQSQLLEDIPWKPAPAGPHRATLSTSLPSLLSR